MSYSRFASAKPSGNPLLYTESENAIEPTQEDIEEFARRIGINPQTEPHLMQLARQGLMEKLPPDWKPCKDSHRDVWFYYNNKTHTSQWDHPMDEVYKDKVVQARQDHAMNRIQSFDVNTPKPLKSLPPLKKSGGGLSPLSFPSTLAKLGPLRNSSFSSSDDISQFSGSHNQLSKLQPLDPLKKSQSLTLNSNNNNTSKINKISNGSLEREPVSRQQRIMMEPAAPAPAPVKKAGLTLTGSGANFLKSAKPIEPDKPEEVEYTGPMRDNDLKKSSLTDVNSNMNKAMEDESKYFQQQATDDSPSPVGQTESSGSESGLGKPLKSILSNSLKARSRLDENSSSTSPRKNLWEISPKNMTDEEYNVWNSLDYKRKTSVKFNLDDPQLVFEFNREESEDVIESEENSVTDDSEEEQDDEDEDEDEHEDGVSKSDRSNEVSKPLGEKPSSAGDGFLPAPPVGDMKPINIIPEPFHKIAMVKNGPRNTDPLQNRDIVPDRSAMKANMDRQIQDFQLKLNEDQKQQETQIKATMEKTVATLKGEMESVITKTKQDFENHKKTEIEKARKEMETNLTSDLEKLRNEYNDKFNKKKAELSTVHHTELQTLEQQNAEAMKKLKTDPKLLEAGKEYERQLALEIQNLKATMDAQHKKQVEEMKSLHSATIQKLRVEFKTEEEKLKKEHSDIIVEMLAKFDSEKQNLLRSFEKEQEKIKQEFSAKASILTTELTQQLESIRKDFTEKVNLDKNMDNSNSSVVVGTSDTSMKTAALQQAEQELSNLKLKYKALEEKYSNLKKGVQSVVVGEKTIATVPPANDSLTLDEHVVVITQPPLHHTNDTDSGAAESDTSSYSISSSGPVHSKAHKRDSDNDDRLHKLMHGNDRLSQALKALDDLKQQIMDIKAEQKQPKKGSSSLEHKLDKNSEQDTHTDEIQVIHNRKKTNVHNATLPLTAAEVRMVKARVSRSDMDTVVKNNKVMMKAASTKDISDEQHYVDSAKDFIKNQKYRLKHSGLAFGTPVSTSVGARQRQMLNLATHSNRTSVSQDRSQTSQYKQFKHHSPDHHSETESSGVGSLRESSGEKSKISQDIEGILSSLQQLDGQMKYLWSVVGSNNIQPQASSTPIMLTPSKSKPDPHIQTTFVGTGGSKDSTNFSDIALKYNLAPNLITPGNQALINSINAVNSAQFRRSLDVSTNPALATLEEQVNNIRHRQSRILKQYPLTGDKRDRSPSISERTKDLREWLEKF